jgi:AcrR family transcriptional regulator
MAGKLISLAKPSETIDRLVDACGEVIAKHGFEACTARAVAQEAGVPHELVVQHYGGIKGVVREFGRSPKFWPDAWELLEGRREAIAAMCYDQRVAEFFKRYLAALVSRPKTLDIMAWEATQRTDLTKILEGLRQRTALEYFEQTLDDLDDSVDLSAIIAVLAAAVHGLVLRSRLAGHFGGIDLWSDEGWRRVEDALDLLMRGVLRHGQPPGA